MGERISVEEALGLELGDAQIFPSAGGKVTHDVILCEQCLTAWIHHWIRTTSVDSTETSTVLIHVTCARQFRLLS
ncbi:MAG: hypothetical protein J07HQX50_00998 [Haloquadratum sp. J07HQX50]|nr:MAG: hypothetical protein J07HQX50_00998 [Haloquadratum sp. J07HQX50]